MPLPFIETPDQAKAVLRLFNSKVDRIRGYSFFEQPIKYSTSWTIGGPREVSVDCASDEQIDAVLLHLRFFMTTNENTSWHHIEKAYAQFSLPAELQTEFRAAFKAWMDWRVSPSKIGGRTNAEVMGAMMYGERVHRNDDKWIQIYDEWMTHIVLQDFSLFVFCDAIHQMVWTLEPMYNINKKVLGI